MQKFLVTLILISASFESIAQAPLYSENAYVVVNMGDTIWGKKVRASASTYLKSIRIENATGIKTTYRANNLLAAGYINTNSNGTYWAEYERIPDPENPAEYLLAERLIDGNRIRLYSHPSGFGLPRPKIRGIGLSLGTFGSGMSIDLGPGDVIPRYIIVKEGFAPIVITEKNFSKVYQQFFSDCPEFSSAIQNNSYVKNFNNLADLIDLYNRYCQ